MERNACIFCFGSYFMCPRIRILLIALLALALGALLCAILPGWLMIAFLGVCALAVGILLCLKA